jgi:hypothetical protein
VENPTNACKQGQSEPKQKPALLDRFFVFRKKVEQPRPAKERKLPSCRRLTG